MRIGVVSDTHNQSRNVLEIIRIFNGEEIDHVIHTGDITTAKTLEMFSKLDVPLSGVFGNNDVDVDSLMRVASLYSFKFQQPPLYLDFHDKRIVVVHDPRELSGSLIRNVDVALHGHTHLHHIEQRDGLTIFNPGECAGHMKGLNAVGVVDLVSIQTSLLKF